MTVQRILKCSPAEDVIEALDELSLQIWIARGCGATWDPIDAPADTPVAEAFMRLRVAMAAFHRSREPEGSDVPE